MGFLDKLFGKTKGNKIKIKFFSEKEAVDEQEQFLISEQDIFLSKSATKSETKNAQQPKKNEKGSISALEDAGLKVSVPCKSQTSPASGLKNTAVAKNTTTIATNNRIDRKKAVPVRDADESPESVGAVTVTESKSTRNGKFDIKKAKDGRYFFSLYASNYAVIAYSQIYSSSTAAMNGIKSIIANAGKTPIEDTTLKTPKTYPFPKWEIYIDKAGEYRFRLYAQNGLCICHSAHGYSTKAGCKGGIESIGRFASDAAKIDKKYLQ